EFGRLGLPVEVLTGDTAERAAKLPLPARAGLLPADKLAAVEEAKAAGGKPLFVGDGINDAAALAASHVGIALASGTDVAVGAADATLYHSDLRVFPWSVELSREAMRTVRRNLYRALCYNLIGMTLAACGVLHPVAAVVLMVLSSLSLIYSSTQVGVIPRHCRDEAGPKPRERHSAWWRAALHGLALVLQGAVFLLLIEGARGWPISLIVLGGFTVAGIGLSYLWNRWESIPHTLDMCFAMLTLGNLGMLLGWWADSGFTPLEGRCRDCIAILQTGAIRAPWMWVGMLLFANAAMLGLARRPSGRSRMHTIAMFTGGNLGMVLGMIAGARCAVEIETETDSLAAGVVASFMGMTIGMLAGMLAGTFAAEKILGAARALSHLPRWLRGDADVSADEVERGKGEADRDDRVADVARR
ncbi:MAG TPA: HAD-IC family P-type ATPase, partial [Gemmata sp.]|nr:HAD-IC family P-type ATPase [Gemmata sp.]